MCAITPNIYTCGRSGKTDEKVLEHMAYKSEYL
jgi:hypothetical protein